MRRQPRDFAAALRRRIDRIYGARLDVIRSPGLPAGHDQIDAAVHDFLDGARLQIDRRQAGGRGDDQPGSVRRVGVLMEVQALAAGLLRQPDDTMTGVRIDPLARRLLRHVAGAKMDGECDQQRHQPGACAHMHVTLNTSQRSTLNAQVSTLKVTRQQPHKNRIRLVALYRTLGRSHHA